MFTIYKSFANHAEGTKFYQVFAVVHVRTRQAVCITHWGKVHSGANYVPRAYGQSQMEEGMASLFTDARNAKRKRGYEFDAPSEVHHRAPAELQETLQQILKPEQLKVVMTKMTDLYNAYEGKEAVAAAAMKLAIEDDKLLEELQKPVVAPVVKSETSKTEHWGSW